jgi:beta-N-acetylglucosaminidase
MYMLCVAVLFTMGMDFGTRSNYYADILTNQPVQINANAQVAAFSILPFTSPIIEDPAQSIVKQQNRQIPIERPVPEVVSTRYEVTSYYLNVRANKNAASEILNVVKNGDILEVLETTDNNWLKLRSGGYVHGKYAKLIRESDQQLSQHSPNKPTSTVNSDSKLTEEQIEQIFEGTSLADHGLEQTILETEQEYGINAYFTIAVMKLESGHGKSKLAKEKNNLFGLNAIDGDAFNKAFSFKTKGESVEKFGQLISENYVDKGYTSIEKVASKYCQANPKWSALVLKIMKSDYKKLTISVD